MATLEERVIVLEKQVKVLTSTLPTSAFTAQNVQQPWWKKIVGVYKDDPEFDEAEQLGRAYRESLRPESSPKSSETDTNVENTP